MPFGKFKGQPIRDLPDQYLDWIVSNIPLREPLLSAVECELEYRGSFQTNITAKPALTVPKEFRAPIREVLERGYRAAARVHHPDAGGDPNEMRILNSARDWLRANLPEVHA